MELDIIRTGRKYGCGLVLLTDLGTRDFHFQGPAGNPGIYIIFRGDEFIGYCKSEFQARRKVLKCAENEAERMNAQYWEGKAQLLYSTRLSNFFNKPKQKTQTGPGGAWCGPDPATGRYI